MKRQILSITMLGMIFFISSCNESASTKISDADVASSEATVATSGKLPILKFDKEEHDFGYINEGDKPSTEFIVTNNGEADLVIVSAQGSCGCTVPEPPKEPIKPGESAPIKVTFDSTGKPGQQQKTVTLTTNTAAGKETCTIKANVKPNPNKPVVKN